MGAFRVRPGSQGRISSQMVRERAPDRPGLVYVQWVACDVARVLVANSRMDLGRPSAVWRPEKKPHPCSRDQTVFVDGRSANCPIARFGKCVPRGGQECRLTECRLNAKNDQSLSVRCSLR